AAIFRYFLGLDQRALSGLTSTIDENGRCIREGLYELACEIATEHSSIIIHCVVDNQPYNGLLSTFFCNGRKGQPVRCFDEQYGSEGQLQQPHEFSKPVDIRQY